MKKEFKRESIELCRRCGGTGYGDPMQDSSIIPICPVCNGTGRVLKVTRGEVMVQPFKLG